MSDVRQLVVDYQTACKGLEEAEELAMNARHFADDRRAKLFNLRQNVVDAFRELKRNQGIANGTPVAIPLDADSEVVYTEYDPQMGWSNSNFQIVRRLRTTHTGS